MTEGEIYRKSGAHEEIGSISGNSNRKALTPEKADSSNLNFFAGEDGSFSEDSKKSKAELLMPNTARFSVSQGVSTGPFGERIEKLRKAVATIFERLGNVND